jgi:hypothetical protein
LGYLPTDPACCPVLGDMYHYMIQPLVELYRGCMVVLKVL